MLLVYVQYKPEKIEGNVIDVLAKDFLPFYVVRAFNVEDPAEAQLTPIEVRVSTVGAHDFQRHTVSILVFADDCERRRAKLQVASGLINNAVEDFFRFRVREALGVTGYVQVMLVPSHFAEFGNGSS